MHEIKNRTEFSLPLTKCIETNYEKIKITTQQSWALAVF